MVKGKSNYQNCVIYKIICKDENIKDMYIGHTCNFSARQANHKLYSINNQNKLYKFIQANGGFDNFAMKMIEEYPCNSKREALIKEREMIDLYNPTLNNYLSTQSYKELRIKHKLQYNDYMREYMREYYKRKKSSKDIIQKTIPEINFTLSFD